MSMSVPVAVHVLRDITVRIHRAAFDASLIELFVVTDLDWTRLQIVVSVSEC